MTTIQEPVDNYTDSDDDDVCVVGLPKPPTPPKAKAYSGGHLTIDIGAMNTDDDANTDSGDEYKCYFLSKVVSGACLLFRRIRIC